MANDDINQIRAQFPTSKALAQKLIDDLEAASREATAARDEVEVARIKAQQGAIAGAQQPTRGAPQIKEDTAALEAENAARKEGLDLELATLDALKEQAALRSRLGASMAQVQRIGAVGAAGLREPTLVMSGVRGGGSYEQLASQRLAREEQQAIAAQRAEEAAITAQLERQDVLRRSQLASMRQIGYQSGLEGRSIQGQRGALIAGPQGKAAESIGGEYTAAERNLARYNLALGEYEGMSARGISSSEALSTNFTRLGMTEAEASQAMRAHGALTTEWLGALGRGETTLSELNYQLGSTVGKVAGWTVATGATFAALGALVEFGKGALDSTNEVEQLHRTLDTLNTDKAQQQLRSLSRETAVGMKEAGDAVFQFSRTFHNQDDAVAAARLGLAAFQLDNVQLADSVRASTAIHQQFGITAQGLSGVYDMLASAQREYNARISDMIPLLQRSTGAVKNAGGDLNQLIQLGAYATRVTQFSGSQVGTAFYRSAATFLSPATTKGQSDLGKLSAMGINTNQGWTEILRDALLKAGLKPGEPGALTDAQRRALPLDIFGPQFGGRMGALFRPQAIPTLEQMLGIRGDPSKALTPGATRGKLNEELDRQLQQVRKQLDQFVFGLQRLGSALAQSGALAPLGLVLRGVVEALNDMAKLVGVFTQLPGPIRDVVTWMTELRLAMLFFSRTRFGSSAPGITAIPGFKPSDATLARAELARGTRATIQALENDIAQNTAQQLTLGARQVTLGQRRAQVEKELNAGAAQDGALAEERTKLTADITALEAQEVALEKERTAMMAARAKAMQQQVAITKTSRFKEGQPGGRATDPQILALQGKVSEDTAGAVERESAQIGIWSASKAKLSRSLATERLAMEGGVAATEVSDVALTEAIGAEEVAAAKITLSSAAWTTAVGATTAVTDAAIGLRGRVLGMVAAMDPLFAALIVLPLAYESFKSTIDATSNSIKAGQKVAQEPVDSIEALQRVVADYHKAAQKQRKQEVSAGSPGPFGIGTLPNVVGGWEQMLGLANAPGTGAATQGIGTQWKAIGDLYHKSAQLFGMDAQDLAGTKKGREELWKVSQEMKQRMGSVLQSSGLPKKQIDDFYRAFTLALQRQYQGAIDSTQAGARGPSLYQLDLRMDPTKLQQQLQAYDDAQKIFGTNNATMQKVLTGYAALATEAAQPGHRTDDQLLQKVASAQSNYINSVTKNVQDAMRSATLATTYRGQLGDLGNALGEIHNAETQIKQMMVRFKGNTAVLAALNELMGQVASQGRQIQMQIMQVMQSQAALKVSQIQGISPESDIRRGQAQVAALQQQVGWARAHGADAQTVNDLQAQLNNAEMGLVKQQTSNARSIVDAQGRLAQSSITGIAPADDIARARQAVEMARQLLAFDQSHGAGTAAILTDQAGVFDAMRALNQQIQQHDAQIRQDAAAFIQAQAGLAEASTLDPVKQARIQLQADIQSLATVKPQDYKTYQEYQTAVLQQQAKIAKDRQDVTKQYVDVQMQSLSFELHTQRITDAQYISGLEQLLKTKKLSLQERQNILTQIFDATHQAAVSLNVDSIRMPTTYEVRSAILRAGARRPPSQQGANYRGGDTVNNNQRVTVNLHVNKDGDLKKVAKALDDALNGNLAGTTQAMGLV